MTGSDLLSVFRKIGTVLLSMILFAIGSSVIGGAVTFIGLTLLQYGLGATFRSPEVGLVSFFWGFGGAVVLGILGGILGLSFGIRRVKRR